MALIFSRLARNFIRNGYFPTDEETMGRLLGALAPAGGTARILDPCCGEGSALADVAQHLQAAGASVESLGVELDRDRAWHAKTLLTRAIHSDLHDVVISPRSVGLLFLNPPYGHGVADKANAEGGEAGEREADAARRLREVDDAERGVADQRAVVTGLGGVACVIAFRKLA